MTQGQFLDATKDIPPQDVQRAVTRVLANGAQPQDQGQSRRFRLLVWLELQGRLRSSAVSPQIVDVPTVVWELRKSGMRLVCSVCPTPQGLRLEESINEGIPFVQVTAKTTAELYGLVREPRRVKKSLMQCPLPRRSLT